MQWYQSFHFKSKFANNHAESTINVYSSTVQYGHEKLAGLRMEMMIEYVKSIVLTVMAAEEKYYKQKKWDKLNQIIMQQ